MSKTATDTGKLQDLAALQYFDIEQSMRVLRLTLDLITEGNEKIIAQDENIILVCGDTGAGKSTLLNYLLGTPLEAVKPSNSRKLIVQTAEGKKAIAKIGHGNNSETFVPQRIEASSSGGVYWDCPGFEDTRGPAIDIANAFYINKLFSTATRLKTIVVVDEAALTGSLRGQAFKDLIIRLTNLFVNPDDLVKSLMLVFTKARDIDDFRQELVSLTEEIKSTLTPDQYSCFKKISTAAPISIFSLPTKAGPISEEEKGQILSDISKLQYVEHPPANITVSVSSLVALQGLVRVVNEQIGVKMKALTDLLSSYPEAIPMKNLENIKQDLTTLRQNEFKNDKEMLCFLHEKIMTNIVSLDAYKVLRPELGSVFNEIEKFVGYFTDFFNKILPDVQVDAAKLKGAFLVNMHHVIEGQILKELHKDNKAKLDEMLDQLQHTKKAHDDQLAKYSSEFNQRLQEREKQLAVLQAALEKEQKGRINLEELLTAQKSTVSTLQKTVSDLEHNAQTAESKIKELEAKGADASLTREMLERYNQQMVELTKQVVELGNRPTSVTYIYEDDDDGICTIG